MLIDAGTLKKGTSDGYPEIRNTLKDKIHEETGGDEEIDYVVVSHNDRDHTRYIPKLVDTSTSNRHIDQGSTVNRPTTTTSRNCLVWTN